MNLLKLINPSLAHIYCSTSLSNHKLIRLKKCLAKYTQSVQLVIFSLYVILHACVQISDVIGCKVLGEELNKALVKGWPDKK
jgi:hypothetical protein